MTKFFKNSFIVKSITLLIFCWGISHAGECRRADCFKLSGDSPVLRKIKPEFFGFNLEWLEFQISVWKHELKSSGNNDSFYDYLSQFEGALYRYPGGLNSNNFVYADSIGDIDERPTRKHVAWADPIRVEFGLREYCDFLKRVNGRPWYVVNLHGEYGRELSAAELENDFSKLQNFFENKENCGGKSLYWELGNELDRDVYKWSSDKYIERIDKVVRRLVVDRNQLVYFQEEYSPRGMLEESAHEYNSKIVKYASSDFVNLSMHAYYDGPPVGPSVDWFRNKIQLVIADAHASGSIPKLWLTEHGRVPSGAYSKGGWKKLWPATYDFDSALSVADMLIALSSIPEVEGLFVHALHSGEGPWKLFKLSNEGHLVPTPPMIALASLRKYMQNNVLYSSKILEGKNSSLNYARVTVMSDDIKKNISLWAVNKDQRARVFRINHRGRKLKFSKCDYFSSVNLNNADSSDANCLKFLTFESSTYDSSIKISIPPHSIIGMQFSSSGVSNVE